MLIFINARCSHTLPDQRMSPSRLATGSAKKAKLGATVGYNTRFSNLSGTTFQLVVASELSPGILKEVAFIMWSSKKSSSRGNTKTLSPIPRRQLLN